MLASLLYKNPPAKVPVLHLLRKFMPRTKPIQKVDAITERFTCEHCTCSYTRQDKLAKHNAKHHPPEPQQINSAPIHPSKMHFECVDPTCLSGFISTSMIAENCQHVQQQTLDQLETWKAYYLNEIHIARDCYNSSKS
jgi:hypothetical protein